MIDSTIANKNIVLGVTGGIACYKSLELVRMLTAKGATVRVVMTKSATEFITPLSFQALSHHHVHTHRFDISAEAAMGHIELAKWADFIIIAPASANTIAKIAQGLAGDLLSTLVLATNAPIGIAPAMNQAMWQQSITQDNMSQLIKRGMLLFPPESGSQACGDVGPGRMIALDSLMQILTQALTPPSLTKQRILITAGPTYEALDPARFLGNYSSGKMGYAIAQAAWYNHANVTLISGPTQIVHPNCQRFIPVNSAQEMYSAVMRHVAHCDIFISCAAVADYRPEAFSTQKIKKCKTRYDLTLIRNPDILTAVAAAHPTLFTVGFAAQSNDLIVNARSKRNEKGIDLICANLITKPGVGFASDDNELTVIGAKQQTTLTRAPKQVLAQQLITLIQQHYDSKQHETSYTT